VKIIDDKGRLFGKLNIIDLLVLAVVVILAFFLGTRFLGSSDNGGAATADPIYLEFTVLSTGVHPESFETVTQFVNKDAGLRDQMMTGEELVPGYIVDAVASPHISYIHTSDGTVNVVQSSGDDRRLDVVFTCIATVYDPVTNKLGTQHIRAGIPHVLKSTHFEFQGSQVLSVKWLDELY